MSPLQRQGRRESRKWATCATRFEGKPIFKALQSLQCSPLTNPPFLLFFLCI